MSDITDNPPPLPILLRYEDMRQWCLRQGNRNPDSDMSCHKALGIYGNATEHGMALLLDDMALAVRQIEAAAFERGKAAMQGEIERLKAEDKNLYLQTLELRAKIKALEEQKPVAMMNPKQNFVGDAFIWGGPDERHPEYSQPIYLAAGAKATSKCGDECKRICQHPDPFGECAK